MSSPIAEIPDFDLIRLIGEGGFGQVWMAVNRATGRLRAVKVIPLQRSGKVDPAGREITSITRLEANVGRRHRNLLNIHHVGKTADHLFYVMDLADDLSGGPARRGADYRPASLQSRLESGPAAADQCLDNARQLLEGLACLHASGMVHRDVKPANCLFVDGELQLADFGLLTEAGRNVSRVGTLKYMPPDGHMDTRADVYAAGLVIYEMISGLPADSFPRLGERGPRVADDRVLGVLVRLALKACDRDPEKRFADAREMLDELNASGTKTAIRRGRKRLRLAAALSGLVAAVVLTVFVLLPGPPPRVHVNFVTHPFEATIHLDGVLLVDSHEQPYRTPCTVDDLPARVCRVVFKHELLPDDLDAGRIDFGEKRHVVGQWSSEE